MEEITTEHYFAEMKALFATEGWRIFQLELRDQAMDLNDLQSTKSLEDLWMRKGQLSAIGQILNCEDTLKRVEADEAEDEEDVLH
jgi:hypothetical protein